MDAKEGRVTNLRLQQRIQILLQTSVDHLEQPLHAAVLDTAGASGLKKLVCDPVALRRNLLHEPNLKRYDLDFALHGVEKRSFGHVSCTG